MHVYETMNKQDSYIGMARLINSIHRSMPEVIRIPNKI